MRKLLAAALIALVLAGCATQQQMPPPGALEIKEYIESRMPLAKNGALKWSDYYKGLFEKYSNSHVPDRAASLQGLTTLIQAAEALESGRIDQASFDSVRRQVIADRASALEKLQRADEQDRIARAAAASQMLQAQRALIPAPAPIPFTPVRVPTQTNCTRFGSQVNCTSY